MAALDFSQFASQPSFGERYAQGQQQALQNKLTEQQNQMQMRSAQNQNALAQYQLSSAQREDASTNALNTAYQNAYDPATGKIDSARLLQSLASSGAGSKIPGVQKSLTEAENALLQRKELEGKINLQPITRSAAEVKLLDDKLKQSRGFLDTLDPAAPDAGARYLAWHEANHADPIIGPALAARGANADQSRAAIQQAINQGPQALANLINQSKLGAEKFMEMNKPTVTSQNLGGEVRVLSTPGLGGAATVVPGSTVATTMTPGQIAANKIAEGQLGVSQGNLNVNRAGLSIRAIAADPYNISGVQAAFPIPGAAPGGIPSPTEKQPSGAPVLQNPAAAMKAGLTGEDFLTHLPKQVAAQVRAIGEGRESSPAARSLTTPAGRQLMDLVNTAYPGYDAKQYGVMSAAEKEFTSRKKGDTTRALNVAVDHLGTLQQVSDALENQDTRLFNQAGNFIALQTGHPAPTDFAAVKRIVADEITKAVLGSAGALGDRTAVDSALNAANSPAQLKQVIDRYKQLMGGQLNGLEQQYTASTGKKDFRDRFLTPATRAALGTAAPASAAPPAAAASAGVKFLGFEPGKP